MSAANSAFDFSMKESDKAGDEMQGMQMICGKTHKNQVVHELRSFRLFNAPNPLQPSRAAKKLQQREHRRKIIPLFHSLAN
ncbi:MAG: hypothetical protein HC827_21220 [Cyanobacteria bacterium RM1_2_2]|nr:hypothetical protein [Cyanobacteria bacterium RM1_2_2]